RLPWPAAVFRGDQRLDLLGRQFEFARRHDVVGGLDGNNPFVNAILVAAPGLSDRIWRVVHQPPHVTGLRSAWLRGPRCFITRLDWQRHRVIRRRDISAPTGLTSIQARRINPERSWLDATQFDQPVAVQQFQVLSYLSEVWKYLA